MNVRKAVLGSARVLLNDRGEVYRSPDQGWVSAIGAIPVSGPIVRWLDVGAAWLGHAAWFPTDRRGV